MFNFLFFVLLGLLLAAVLFERFRFQTLAPLLITLAAVLVVALILAGAPFWVVLIGGLVCLIGCIPFVYPRVRKRFLLVPFTRRARRFADARADERAWFDEEQPASDDEGTPARTSFLTYLNAGRFEQQFVVPKTEAPLRRDEDELLLARAPRLCRFWSQASVAERGRFIRQEGFANLENGVSSYALFRLLTHLAVHDSRLAETVFNMNNGLATLLATRGTSAQKKRFLTRIARQVITAHLIAPDLSTACGLHAHVGKNEVKGQEVTGLWLEPGWLPLRVLPVRPDLCGLCLPIRDVHHVLVDQEMADVCILVPSKVLHEHGLMQPLGEDAGPAQACFVRLDQVIVLTATDLQHVVYGRCRIRDDALLLARTLQLIQFGGCLVAAQMRFDNDLDPPLRAFADLRRLVYGLDASQRFACEHRDVLHSPFEANEVPCRVFNRAKRELMQVLPMLAKNRTDVRPASPACSIPLGETQLRSFWTAFLEEEDQDQRMRADRMLSTLLSRWGQGIIRSFGLGISCGFIAAQAKGASDRALAHLTAVFGCLFDTQILLDLWRGTQDRPEPCTRAYHSLIHAYSMLMHADANQSQFWHPGSTVRTLMDWVDHMPMPRGLRIVFKWMVLPLGNIYGAIQPTAHRQTGEPMIIPTSERAQLLRPFAENLAAFAVTEELCKLAWAVKDLCETHALDHTSDQKHWYERLLKTKQIGADEAKLLRRFYDIHQEVLKIYVKAFI